MKTLITGGAGYLGSVLTGVCLDRGDEVTVLDNLMYGQTSLLPYFGRPGFSFVQGDVRDLDLLESLVAGFEKIVHLAAIVGAPACDKDVRQAAEVNFDATRNLSQIIRDHQVFIYPNTNSGYGTTDGEEMCTEESPLNPVSQYGHTKVRAERAVLATGISFRLATLFGVSPRMRLDLLVNDFTYRARRDGYLVLFEPHFKRNFVHVRDVAELFARRDLAGYRGQIFNVGLDEANTTKLGLAERIREHVPGLRILCDDVGHDPDKRNYIVSSEKLAKTLGWKPARSLDAGISEILASYPILSCGEKVYSNK